MCDVLLVEQSTEITNPPQRELCYQCTNMSALKALTSLSQFSAFSLVVVLALCIRFLGAKAQDFIKALRINTRILG